MDLSAFLDLLSPKFIYEGGQNMAVFIASTISPVLLVLAIWLRLASNQLDSVVSGSGNQAKFFVDLAVWATVLGLYFVLASFLSEFFNSLYAYFESRGSLGAILSSFAAMIEKVDKAGDDADLTSQSLSLLTSPVTFVVWLIYYVSFLIATFILKFLNLAHAICWSFALVWGLVAIPMSITKNFKLLKGWAVFSGISLLWPLIHFGSFALFNPIFQHAADEFVTGSGAGLASLDKAQLYIIMTFTNILSVALAVAAPFITMSLVSNSGSIAGVVAPFASAAIAAGAAAAQQMRAAGSVGGSTMGRMGATAGKDMINGRNPLNRIEQGFERIRESIMGQPQSEHSSGSNGGSSGGFTPQQDSGSNAESSSGSGAQSSTANSSVDNAAPAGSSPSTPPPNAKSSTAGPSVSTMSAVASAASSAGGATGEGFTTDAGPVEEASKEPPAKSSGRSAQGQQRRGAIINQNKFKPSKG